MATIQNLPTQQTTNVHGQQVTKSRIIKFVIGLVLFATLFYAFTSWWNHRPKNYNLIDTKYGKSLVIEIGSGEVAKVKLTHDWCPFWSDGLLNVHDDEGAPYTLEGSRFVQFNTGKPQGEMNMEWTFKNKTKNSITLKIGRCKSKTDCSINFEQN